jgi:GAF domain-containing protein
MLDSPADGPNGADAHRTSETEVPPAGMAFVQVARLGFDDILEQLLVRAREVQETQGRLRGLLQAFLEVGRADSLDAVLRHVVEAARRLVDARYAALGVIKHERLVRFVHTGMDPAVVARIGHLPQGKGLLGLLIEQPQTLRLPDMADHHASVGFPDGHPPMRTLLGVPVRDGDQTLGTLYLTEKADGAEFTADDQQLVQALAVAAAAAITNATLLHESRRRHTWQTAMIDVSTQLLAGTDSDEVLRQLVQHACHTLAGIGAAVSVPTDDPLVLRVAVTEGGAYDAWAGALVPIAGSINGTAIAAGELAVIADPSTDTRTRATAARTGGALGQTVAVPLIRDDVVNGVLTVSRAPDADPFDDVDLDLIAAVAAHTGLALQLSQARTDNAELQRLTDRDHIGDDLRQHVIHRLFKHGLDLQAVASRITQATQRAAVQQQITEVDAIIRDIRNVVFALGTDPAGESPAAAPDRGVSPQDDPPAGRTPDDLRR